MLKVNFPASSSIFCNWTLNSVAFHDSQFKLIIIYLIPGLAPALQWLPSLQANYLVIGCPLANAGFNKQFNFFFK